MDDPRYDLNKDVVDRKLVSLGEGGDVFMVDNEGDCVGSSVTESSVEINII